MNLYEVLGVPNTATLSTIKKAWRKAARFHPDNKDGGDRAKFEEAKLAYEVLSSPVRRKRYDTTGRIDDNPITSEKIRSRFEYIMGEVINAQRPDGTTDDPRWENIRDKILLTIEGARAQVRRDRAETQRKLHRAKALAKRFKPKQDDDPIGEVLKTKVEDLQRELNGQDDAIEESMELSRIIRTYDYEVGPDPEGQCEPGPTTHRLLSGISVTTLPRDLR